MAKIISFSKIDNHFSNDGNSKYCLCDTNYLIACIHAEHTFYTPSVDFFKKASGVGFSFFVTHTSRTEFLDIERKFAITRPLISLYREEDKWSGKIKKESKDEMQKAVERVVESKEGFEFFSDAEIKKAKLSFFPFSESGKVGWINFCDMFISKELSAAWDNLIKKIGINYLEIREEEKSLGEKDCLLKTKIDWNNMVAIVGKTAMGTSDAMIANVFINSNIEVLVTTDYDLAYALAVDLDDTKIVAIPDNMFNKHKKDFEKIAKRRS